MKKKPTKKEIFAKRKPQGLDAERKERLKRMITKPHIKIEPHKKADDHYDWTEKQRWGKYKRKNYVEHKGPTGNLSPAQKKMKEQHPRSYEVVRSPTDTKFHSAMNVGRKLKKFLKD